MQHIQCAAAHARIHCSRRASQRTHTGRSDMFTASPIISTGIDHRPTPCSVPARSSYKAPDVAQRRLPSYL
jgi:hypothetical protein